MKKINWNKTYKKEVATWTGRLKKPPEEIRDFLKYLKKYKVKGKILDVGCGDGNKTIFMARAGYNVIGVDISKEAIAKAKKQFKNKNLSFKILNVEKLPFEKESFSAIFSRYVLNFTNLKKSSEVLYKVLRKGGIAYLLLFTKTIDKEHPKVKSREKEILAVFRKFKLLKKKKAVSTEFKPRWHKHYEIKLLLQKL